MRYQKKEGCITDTHTIIAFSQFLQRTKYHTLLPNWPTSIPFTGIPINTRQLADKQKKLWYQSINDRQNFQGPNLSPSAERGFGSPLTRL